MINLKEYLLNSNIDIGTYALVVYEGRTEPTYFAKHKYEGNDWFLEYPCQLYKVSKITMPVDEFAIQWVKELYELEDGESVEEFAKKHIKPMIIDNVLYEINNFQCSPYLPEEVYDIRLISERECLEYMLAESKLKK